MQKYLLLGLAGIAVAGSLAFAGKGDTPGSIESNADAALLQSRHPNLAREQYIASVLGPFRQLDRENDGLDRQDIERQKKQLDARWRASQISQILQHDYDGNFSVSPSEIQEFASGDADTRRRQADRILDEYDANGDGKVTLDEATTNKRIGRSHSLEGLLAADQNGDGKVTAAELLTLAQATFDRFDSNGDGLISQEEYKPVAERRRALAEVKRLSDAGCSFPAPSAQTRIVGFGAYQGDTISSSYVGGPDDETSVIDVRIERGDQPLYLLFTSHQPVIWRLTGDVGRVERIVASAHRGVGSRSGRNTDKHSAVGVMGVPKSRVSITSATCLPDIRPVQNGETGRNREMAEVRIAAVAGRGPDVLFGEYSPFGVKLPSGSVFPAPEGANTRPEGFDSAVWQEAARYWGGGLANINPDKVVAAVPVEPYRVLPSQMGLAQLVGHGAARKLEGNRFLLLRDIARIPPRMTGAHSAVLVLSEGVKHPPGDPGHGCVVTLAEAARTAGRAICRPPRAAVVPASPPAIQP